VPELSVVIPTLGRPAILARALERLANQVGAPDFEVIVVADAAEQDISHVSVIAAGHRFGQAERPGVSAARNHGLRIARAPLVLFLGDDILAEPGLLAAHAAAHARQSDEDEAVAVQGHVRWADELGRTPFMDFLDEGRWQFDFPREDEFDAGWGRFYACNLSVKRSFVIASGGFDESFTWGYEELELACRLRDRGLALRWAPWARAEHLHRPEIAAWEDRMRRVARAERQMIELHPDIEPFFARRAEQILGARRGRGQRLRRLLPPNPRIRASTIAAYERRLASAFLSAWTAPAVDPAVYDEDYYRASCAGSGIWQSSNGEQFDPLYAGSLQRAGLQAGDVVVDVGTGRGELLVAALAMGAARAVGVEYSADAATLARHTLEVHGAGERAEVLLADARVLPLPDEHANLVTMLDVVEHLTTPELDAALAEAHRILRPGGQIFIHTLPSRTLYEVTYRLQRSLTPRRRREWPREPRNALELRMHVGEQTVRSLRAALQRAGFSDLSVEPGMWIHDAFVPEERPRRLYRRLAAFPLTRRLGAADLWATGHRPPGRSTR